MNRSSGARGHRRRASGAGRGAGSLLPQSASGPAALVPAVVAAAVVVPAAPPPVAAVPVPVSPVIAVPLVAAAGEGAVHAA